jgi:hypothetical protein
MILFSLIFNKNKKKVKINVKYNFKQQQIVNNLVFFKIIIYLKNSLI